VGGEVALAIVGHEPRDHTIRIGADGIVEIVAEAAKAPVVTIGIKPKALFWLLEGTLDVPKAFERKRLALEGDPKAMQRFAECFTPGKSWVGAQRTR
jgi:hypothetical protein